MQDNPGLTARRPKVTSAALFVAVFLACAVEAVEALTIVLAAGTARDWRSALWGVGAGLSALAVIVAALGPALTAIPIDALRMVIGGLLLIFGLQWLRKVILRATGHKALHDESRIFDETLAAARSADSRRSAVIGDWYAFTLSFKGLLLEGLEVAFIVLTFGVSQGGIGTATVAALCAVALVTGVGIAVMAPLARVPENGLIAVGRRKVTA
ncbi:TMEM165/GDT1 family protein [Kutzneria sp. 744]|uniref:TMEM165/GDT1 family protein n=1 Tax=Kutzneria sp. (strain 744) TaxID=345341 RepID=UPI0012F79756|nr:TMEM165/GDT1 family protein [Kutzneria sp. 744]